MEGIGNYNPDDKRELSVVEKSINVLTNLGEYVPSTWKNKLRLYEHNPGHSGGWAASYGGGGGGGSGGGASKRHMMTTFSAAAVAPPPDQGNGHHQGAPIPTFSDGSLYSSGNFNLTQSTSVIRPPPVITQQLSPNRRHKEQLVTEPPAKGEYEARLVRKIVQPGGARSRPTTTELSNFKNAITGLDLDAILANLSSFICDEDQTWPWRYRALAILMSLMKPESRLERDLYVRVVQWLKNSDGSSALIGVLRNPPENRQCISLCEQILSLTEGLPEGGGGASEKGDAPSRERPPYPLERQPARNLDLLDIDESSEGAAGGLDSSVEESSTTFKTALERRPNLLDDLL